MGPLSVCEHGSQRRKCDSCMARVMEQVLDTAEHYLRTGQVDKCVETIFIWSQNATDLLVGSTTWEAQRA